MLSTLVCNGDDEAPLLSVDYLREMFHEKGFHDLAESAIPDEIWEAIQQVKRGEQINVPAGRLAPVSSCLDTGGEDAALAGLLWMVMLLAAFMVVGKLTLPEKRRLKAPWAKYYYRG